MKIFMIILFVAMFTLPVFLIAKYGIKKKELSDFIAEDRKFD